MLVLNAFVHDTRVQKETRTLIEAGYEVVVFALHSEGLLERQALEGYYVERIRVRSRGWGTHPLIRLLKYLEFNLRAIRRVVRLRPTVVHAHDANALVPGYLAARLARARLIYDAHELWSERHASLLHSDLLCRVINFIEGALARRAAAVITVNPSIAQLLAEMYRLPTPVVLMHSQEYREVERNDVLRQELKIPADMRIVIYAGRFLPARGLDKLIEAAPHLDRAVVVLMGPDSMNGRVHQLVAEKRLKDRVIIREPVPPDQVLRYVASADLGVIPTQSVDLSYHYSAGNKLFHYMMAGIPAAVSDQPEKRRIVETYGVGAVFDQTNPQDIARVINGLLNDRPGYQDIRRRARQVSRDVFNWKIEERRLLALYDQILGNHEAVALPGERVD